MKVVLNNYTGALLRTYTIGEPTLWDSEIVIETDLLVAPIYEWEAVRRDSEWVLQSKDSEVVDSEKRIAALVNIRADRNKLIATTDWTQFPDSPLTAEKKQEWQTYRQSLRDITKQDVFNISWPTKPE